MAPAMSKTRLHPRLRRPDVAIDSPLIDCQLVNLSTSGLAIETSAGLRLGVPYPFRLRHGEVTVSTEAEVRWCRFIGNATTDHGDWQPVYRAGAAFVEWQPMGDAEPASAFEQQIDSTLDDWIERSRTPGRDDGSERTIVQHTPRRRG